MIKVENIDAWGFEHAIRGMRNPMNSWDNSDSFICRNSKDCPDYCPFFFECSGDKEDFFVVGEKDINLMRSLYIAGTEHRKYLRQICVSMDIIAPLYWWKEFDTYKVGTVANSCSTMHKIHSKEFTLDDFSTEHLDEFSLACMNHILDRLNGNREAFITSKDKKYWWQMIQLLPSSYNQRRTVTLNYENVMSMINQRTGHKLDEWNEFVEILKGIPYVEEIMERKNS